jgi:hypothetical protein
LSACSQAESLKFKLVQVPHHRLFFLHDKPRAPSSRRPPAFSPTNRRASLCAARATAFCATSWRTVQRALR